MKKLERQNAVTLLAKGTRIRENKLYLPSSSRISGEVALNVECDGKLVIDQDAEIRGNVKARDLVLYGRIEGNVWVEKKARIFSTAYLYGSISSHSVEIEEGAYCQFEAAVNHLADNRHEKAVVETPVAKNAKPKDTSSTPTPETSDSIKKDGVENGSSATEDEKDESRKPDPYGDHFW